MSGATRTQSRVQLFGGPADGLFGDVQPDALLVRVLMPSLVDTVAEYFLVRCGGCGELHGLFDAIVPFLTVDKPDV